MKLSWSAGFLMLGLMQLPGTLRNVHGDDTSQQFFLDNYPQAFEVLEAKLRNVEGSCRIVREMGKQPKRFFGAEFAINGSSEKVVLHETSAAVDNKSLLDRVFCVSEGTYFSLMRTPLEAAYSVTGIGTDDADRIDYTNLFRKFVKAPLGVFGSRLIDTLRSPTFRLKEANWVGKPGESFFKIRYEAGQMPSVNDVEVTFDPQASWVITSARVATADMPGAALTFEVEYDKSTDRPYFPVKVRYEDVDGKVETCRFERFEREVVPEDQFSFHYFGLPNPEPKASPYRGLWYVLGFSSLGLMALLIRFLTARNGAFMQAPSGA